jgi:hypothetical protein
MPRTLGRAYPLSSVPRSWALGRVDSFLLLLSPLLSLFRFNE